MKVDREGSQYRRRSSSSSIFLFIPYLNVIFYLFQARGAYNSIKNYYQINNKLPSAIRSLVIAIKYSFYGTLISMVWYCILIIFTFNPFGKVASFYLSKLGNVVAGLLSPVTAGFWFGDVLLSLELSTFNLDSIICVALYIFFSYFIFSIISNVLAAYNIKSDLRRNLIESAEI